MTGEPQGVDTGDPLAGREAAGATSAAGEPAPAGSAGPEVAAAWPAPTPIGPIPLEERIGFIDVLRGLALFGIIAANLRGFAGPSQAYFDPKLVWNGFPDRAAQFAVDVLIQGKFITLFAFLFGVGYSVQLARAQARNASILRYYPRRLGALLLIGLAHELLLWWGDILAAYALGGFALLLFRKRSDKAVLRWAIGLTLFPVLSAAGYVIAQQFGAPPPKPPDPAKVQSTIKEAIRIYGSGSFSEIFVRRLEDLKPQYAFMPVYLPNIVGTFLLGVWVWRKGILQNLHDHLPLLRKTMTWGLLAGLSGNLLARAIVEASGSTTMQPTPRNLGIWSIQAVAVPSLSLGYASLLAIVYSRAGWRQRLAPFAAVGRTALSNYLFQSLVCTTIFYSYGLALFAKGGPLLYFVPTLAVYGLELPLSVWWLKHYRFGPVEWVWRSMTYGNAPPFRR